MSTLSREVKIAVVIPCFRVRTQLPGVIRKIGPEVLRIYVVDDACPEHSAEFARDRCNDSRIKIIRHAANRGVGGAVISGYREAIKDGMDIVIKIDGDGQMDPALIPAFVNPIIKGKADYTKGNRFFSIQNLKKMPRVRIFGNAVLSFLNKLSSGYWSIFDPTNGYTAINTKVLKILPLELIDNKYLFETDMLYQLGLIRAVVVDVPMVAEYGDEISNLRISKEFSRFLTRHITNSFKRILYNYYLRDFSIASVELAMSFLFIAFGVIFGVFSWAESSAAETFASSGSVMLAAMPIIIGCQLLISFLAYDIGVQPKIPVSDLIQIRNPKHFETGKQEIQ